MYPASIKQKHQPQTRAIFIATKDQRKTHGMFSSWIPCEDLAIDLRVRLGDWFRVIQLAHGANEETPKRQKREWVGVAKGRKGYGG